MKYILEVSRYLDNDVIATSYSHYSIAGMTNESYQMEINADNFDVCDWNLISSSPSANGIGGSFTYYNENGSIVNTNLYTNGWITIPEPEQYMQTITSSKWFHIYEDENKNQFYIYCNDESHHHK